VKCAVVERAQRTIRYRIYKYLTYKITFRFIDVLQKFVRAYNDTDNSTTDMAPSRVRIGRPRHMEENEQSQALYSRGQGQI